MSGPTFRLTDLAHGGGCGCKLAPSVLQQLLAKQPAAGPFAQLLVGTETGDDAAVWQIDDEHCIVATTDFFMPMVDDPRDFGRIAAANAISDVYAMGGKPVMALAILGMPLDKLPVETVRAILEGGASVCAEAGIPVAGGHSIDAPEPIYGLAVIGLAKPGNVRRNSGAKPGDALILTKGIGVGIYSAAFKKRALPDDAYAEMIASTTLLNRIGQTLGENPDVHAITDVTGFGLLGHGLEVARGSGVRHRYRLRPHSISRARRGFGRGWICDGRVGAQLGELRRGCRFTGRNSAMAEDVADRSANVGRSSRRLRRRAGRRYSRHHRGGRLSERAHHRLGIRR